MFFTSFFGVFDLEKQTSLVMFLGAVERLSVFVTSVGLDSKQIKSLRDDLSIE